MSRKREIYAQGKIEGRYTRIRLEVLDSAAWKATRPGARLLYIALLRRLNFKTYNNGKVYLATRTAAAEIGVRHRAVWSYYCELEHYGFIVTTRPGYIGPKGVAAHWRITDHGWGNLDGHPIRATKEYLQWDGTLFEQRPKNRKGVSKKTTARSAKDNIRRSAKDNGSGNSFVVQKTTKETPKMVSQKTTNLDSPSPIREAQRPAMSNGPAPSPPAQPEKPDALAELERLLADGAKLH